MMEPGCHARTISAVIRIGAFLPGTAAVVITTSLLGEHLGHHLALPAVEFLAHGFGIAAFVFGARRFQARRTWRPGFPPVP